MEKYNLRYARDRERLYSDLLEKQREILAAIKDPVKRQETASAMRIVVDIGGVGDAAKVEKWSSKNPEQGAGGFRGFRTFSDLRLLKAFLTGSSYSGVFSAKGAGKYRGEARIVMFKRRGRRVTGEKVFHAVKVLQGHKRYHATEE